MHREGIARDRKSGRHRHFLRRHFETDPTSSFRQRPDVRFRMSPLGQVTSWTLAHSRLLQLLKQEVLQLYLLYPIPIQLLTIKHR